MEKVEWDKQYNIGVDIIDKAHAKLFRIVGKLIELSNNSQTYRHTFEEGIKYLEDYCMKHFSEEEGYMRSIHYSGYARHKQLHNNFRDKILISLKNDLRLSDYSPSVIQRFIGIMIGWLTGHIMVEDQAIVGKVTTKKVYHSSSNISVIAKAVNHTMQDVFRVEANLADDKYKGQNIGKALYCRLHYDIDDTGKVQLLLGIEEPLIYRGVGQMIGERLIQKGQMVNEASLQLFQQLFRHMGKLFRTEAEYELSKNDMLDKDEFRADFMKGYPYSLLFSTRLGYFAFCFRSWRIPQEKPETSPKQEEETQDQPPTQIRLS